MGLAGCMEQFNINIECRRLIGEMENEQFNGVVTGDRFNELMGFPCQAIAKLSGLYFLTCEPYCKVLMSMKV